MVGMLVGKVVVVAMRVIVVLVLVARVVPIFLAIPVLFPLRRTSGMLKISTSCFALT